MDNDINKLQLEEGVSPKLISLAQHIEAWFNQYTEEDFKNGKGVSAVLFAHDKDVENSRLFYSLYDKDNPQGDIITAIDHGIAGFLKNENSNNSHDTKLVFESMAQFMALIFAKFPHIYDSFQRYVEKYQQAMKDNIEEGKNGIIV